MRWIDGWMDDAACLHYDDGSSSSLDLLFLPIAARVGYLSDSD